MQGISGYKVRTKHIMVQFCDSKQEKIHESHEIFKLNIIHERKPRYIDKDRRIRIIKNQLTENRDTEFNYKTSVSYTKDKTTTYEKL